MALGNSLTIAGAKIVAERSRALRWRRSVVEKSPQYIEDIQIASPRGGPAGQHALLSLVPSAWMTALAELPNIRRFNQSGLTYEMVKALNEKGYTVDIADYTKPGIRPRKNYSLFVGHGCNTRGILDELPRQAFVLHYASSSYWREFNRMSQERYDDFYRRRGLAPAGTFVRSVEGTEGEEFLARRADAAFLSGPRTVTTFDGISKNMSLLYLGATVEEDLFVSDRDFEKGRKAFLYVAGTGGNVQKGLDLLLEAFSRLPHLHLYIYCDVEEEILRAYRRELDRPNVHYIYHYRLRPLRQMLRRVLRRINFTITAPIDIGPGTAFLGSMGLGLIPVGYVDIEAENTNSVLTDSPTIEALMDCAERASAKSADWCQQASLETRARFTRLHTPQAFGLNFRQLLDRLPL